MNLTTVAASSLSAKIVQYRTGKQASKKTIMAVLNKANSLKESGNITDDHIAKLCIRMSEGCIDKNDTNNLSNLSTPDLVSKVQKYSDEFDEQLIATKKLETR